MIRSLPRATLLLLTVGLGACEKSTEADTTAATATAPTARAAVTATAAPPDANDPCRLLAQTEVETALGAPLAGPPFRSNDAAHSDGGLPNPQGKVCWYETETFANVALQFTRSGGGRYMAGVGGWIAKAEDGSQGMITLQNGTELVGEWDEVRVVGCCIFMALRGDSVVEIDYGGSALTEAQAAELANQALLRLEQPLDINGRDGLTAAEARQARRPRPQPPCSIFSDDDLRATVGASATPPAAGSTDCTYTITGRDGRTHELLASATWRNGYRGHRVESHMTRGMLQSVGAGGAAQAEMANERAQMQRELGEMGAALRGLGLGDLQGLTDTTATQIGDINQVQQRGSGGAIDGPWDIAELSAAQLSAVRRDVRITVRQAGLPDDAVHALIGRSFDRYERTP